jgi:GDPmannose 4,6-dehydratase
VSGVAVITGASGQDGFFVAQRLLLDGWTVHGTSRTDSSLAQLSASVDHADRLHPHRLDILDEPAMTQLIQQVRPDEIYNLAGQSSVSTSFADPVQTWRTNAESVFLLLEIVRREAPEARVYQSSSGEMFGWGPEVNVVHDEGSIFLPQSPYAAAKAAAHIACGTYRRVFGLRVACGILFNHESHRRPGQFLTRKVIDYVRQAKAQPEPGAIEPLRVGNLRAQRDWGFAPDFAEGIVNVLHQVAVRGEHGGGGEPDTWESYRDYVLATGRLHSVWQLIDRAFETAGLQLEWHMDSEDESEWHATYRSGARAVVVDPSLLRPSDPLSIAADASLARRELGWNPQVGLDPIIHDMLEHA